MSTRELGSLILVVVVDLVVPEQGLVPIAPAEVPGSNVLVRVLDALLQWWQMRPMLPMLVPQVVCIDSGKNEARDHTAMRH
jgi:hypothetical protein